MAARALRCDQYKLRTTFDGDDTTIHTAGQGVAEAQTKWRRKRDIGTGASGIVWLEEEEGEGKRLRAVKRLQQVTKDADWSRELSILIQLRDHQDLFVAFLGWYEDKNFIYFAMEFIEHGDLSQHLRKFGSKVMPQAKDIVTQLLKGLVILHRKRICHRDIKPKNILIASTSPIWVKIADFGVSKNQENTSLHTRCGTLGYLAPELQGFKFKSGDSKGSGNSKGRKQKKGRNQKNGPSYTDAVDIWSLGILTHKILTLELPFLATDLESESESGLEQETEQEQEQVIDPTLLSKYCEGQRDFPTESLQKSKVSNEGIEFVKVLLAADPYSRMSAAQALKSPWLLNKHPEPYSAWEAQPKEEQRIKLEKQLAEIQRKQKERQEGRARRRARKAEPEYKEREARRNREWSKVREDEAGKARREEIKYIRKNAGLDRDKEKKWPKEKCYSTSGPLPTGDIPGFTEVPWSVPNGVPRLVETPPTPPLGTPRFPQRLHCEGSYFSHVPTYQLEFQYYGPQLPPNFPSKEPVYQVSTRSESQSQSIYEQTSTSYSRQQTTEPVFSNVEYGPARQSTYDGSTRSLRAFDDEEVPPEVILPVSRNRKISPVPIYHPVMETGNRSVSESLPGDQGFQTPPTHERTLIQTVPSYRQQPSPPNVNAFVDKKASSAITPMPSAGRIIEDNGKRLTRAQIDKDNDLMAVAAASAEQAGFNVDLVLAGLRLSTVTESGEATLTGRRPSIARSSSVSGIFRSRIGSSRRGSSVVGPTESLRSNSPSFADSDVGLNTIRGRAPRGEEEEEEFRRAKRQREKEEFLVDSRCRSEGSAEPGQSFRRSTGQWSGGQPLDQQSLPRRSTEQSLEDRHQLPRLSTDSTLTSYEQQPTERHSRWSIDSVRRLQESYVPAEGTDINEVEEGKTEAESPNKVRYKIQKVATLGKMFSGWRSRSRSREASKTRAESAKSLHKRSASEAGGVRERLADLTRHNIEEWEQVTVIPPLQKSRTASLRDQELNLSYERVENDHMNSTPMIPHGEPDSYPFEGAESSRRIFNTGFAQNMEANISQSTPLETTAPPETSDRPKSERKLSTKLGFSGIFKAARQLRKGSQTPPRVATEESSRADTDRKESRLSSSAGVSLYHDDAREEQIHTENTWAYSSRGDTGEQRVAENVPLPTLAVEDRVPPLSRSLSLKRKSTKSLRKESRPSSSTGVSLYHHDAQEEQSHPESTWAYSLQEEQGVAENVPFPTSAVEERRPSSSRLALPRSLQLKGWSSR